VTFKKKNKHIQHIVVKGWPEQKLKTRNASRI
jgi:hypothetical protein